jgi:hypothetical protein
MEINFRTKEFLATHTNSTDEKEMRNAYSTIRDSKTVANAWHQLLNETMIASIDDSCSEVLTALNYEHTKQ